MSSNNVVAAANMAALGANAANSNNSLLNNGGIVVTHPTGITNTGGVMVAAAQAGLPVNAVPLDTSAGIPVAGGLQVNNNTNNSLVSGAVRPRPSLSAVEVAAVRQLITGYRESAAFLLRSAEELQSLIQQQGT